jgi:hypothetical protein
VHYLDWFKIVFKGTWSQLTLMMQIDYMLKSKFRMILVESAYL